MRDFFREADNPINITGGGNMAKKGVFLVVGLIFFTVSGVFAFKSISFLNNSTEVDARVISVDSKIHTGKKMSRSVVYRPTFEFKDAQGRDVKATTSETSRNYRYSVGSTVKILYDKNDPTIIKIPGFVGLWLIPTIIAPIGLVFFLVGLFAKRN
jgi:hypothetical protein